VPELGISNGVLDAGRYRLRGFEPPITVGLDGTWSSLAQIDHYAALENTPGMPGLLVQIGLVGSIGERDLAAAPMTAEDAASAVQRIPGAAVVETSASQIGGRDGFQVTLERPDDGSLGTIVLLLGVPAGGIGLTPGARIWIAFFDTPQGVVAIMVRGTIDDWERDLALAEPVLEQIRFEVP
jgi:hypothetical protein